MDSLRLRKDRPSSLVTGEKTTIPSIVNDSPAEATLGSG